MNEKDFLAAALAVCAGSLLLVWVFLPDSPFETDENDGPGPNMIIEMGGNTSGFVVIDLRDDLAPRHVDRLVGLAEAGYYNTVVFHRVIDGFMAQTGDIEHGRLDSDLRKVGTGRSGYGTVPAEFSDEPFVRGTVGMARGLDVDSADSQFFIVLEDAPSLNGQYTVVGRVVAGMEAVDGIKRGDPANNGAVETPDFMAQVHIER